MSLTDGKFFALHSWQFMFPVVSLAKVPKKKAEYTATILRNGINSP